MWKDWKWQSIDDADAIWADLIADYADCGGLEACPYETAYEPGRGVGLLFRVRGVFEKVEWTRQDLEKMLCDRQRAETMWRAPRRNINTREVPHARDLIKEMFRRLGRDMGRELIDGWFADWAEFRARIERLSPSDVARRPTESDGPPARPLFSTDLRRPVLQALDQFTRADVSRPAAALVCDDTALSTALLHELWREHLGVGSSSIWCAQDGHCELDKKQKERQAYQHERAPWLYLDHHTRRVDQLIERLYEFFLGRMSDPDRLLEDVEGVEREIIAAAGRHRSVILVNGLERSSGGPTAAIVRHAQDRAIEHFLLRLMRESEGMCRLLAVVGRTPDWLPSDLRAGVWTAPPPRDEDRGKVLADLGVPADVEFMLGKVDHLPRGTVLIAAGVLLRPAEMTTRDAEASREARRFRSLDCLHEDTLKPLAEVLIEEPALLGLGARDALAIRVLALAGVAVTEPALVQIIAGFARAFDERYDVSEGVVDSDPAQLFRHQSRYGTLAGVSIVVAGARLSPLAALVELEMDRGEAGDGVSWKLHPHLRNALTEVLERDEHIERTRSLRRLIAEKAYERALEARLGRRGRRQYTRSNMGWDALYVYQQLASLDPDQVGAALRVSHGQDQAKRGQDPYADNVATLHVGASPLDVIRAVYRHHLRDIEDQPNYRLISEFGQAPLKLGLLECWFRIGSGQIYMPHETCEGSLRTLLQQYRLPPLEPVASAELVIALGVAGVHLQELAIRERAQQLGRELIRQDAGWKTLAPAHRLSKERISKLRRQDLDLQINQGELVNVGKAVFSFLGELGLKASVVRERNQLLKAVEDCPDMDTLAAWASLLPRLLEIRLLQDPVYYRTRARFWVEACNAIERRFSNGRGWWRYRSPFGLQGTRRLLRCLYHEIAARGGAGDQVVCLDGGRPQRV